MGAELVIADALDGGAVKAAVVQIRPEAVINELTSLPRHYNAAKMAAAERDRQVRTEGNKNLLAALQEVGARRYLLQSSGFWYAPGAGLADENEPFAFAASPAVVAGACRYAELERTAAVTPGIDFVALRYGFFYSPGTWFDADGDMGAQVRQGQVAVIGEGQGVWSWVHVEDAATATTAALGCAPGAYNIVDDDPSPQHGWLPAFASAIGAPPPPRISEVEATTTLGPDAVYYATRLRGATNGKTKRELNFRPRPLQWFAAVWWTTP